MFCDLIGFKVDNILVSLCASVIKVKVEQRAKSRPASILLCVVQVGRVVKMTGVDEILNYQRNPDDDYYALLGCDEHSTVSEMLCVVYNGNL